MTRRVIKVHVWPLVALMLAFIFLCPAIVRGQTADDKTEVKEANVPKAPDLSRIDWKGLVGQTFSFLSVEHSIRLSDERIRAELRGPFIEDWGRSIKSIHGWNDGDNVIANWVGHPMQGAVAAFIYANNSRSALNVEFGTREYWNSKKEQLVFAFVYSELFELGPMSEASLGNLGYRYGKNSFIDHVTPAVGVLVWSVAEDAIYHYYLRPLSEKNPRLANTLIIFLNPTRSFANVLALKYPWRGPAPR